MLRKIFIVLVIVGAVAGVFARSPYFKQVLAPNVELAQNSSDAQLQNAFENRLSGRQIKGSGKVIKVLPDDNKGRKHQRFILRLASGQTLFVAHNIDLAPRIKLLSVGDVVDFYGEYEWNDKGGVIHWTHHDPAGRHTGGWLRHNDIVYQ